MPNHLYTAHPDVSNGTVYKCDKCDYTTLSKFSISSHKKSHSLQLQECPVCKRKVKYLSKHIKRGNCVNKKEPIPCELCDKVFTDKWHVKRHVKIVHMQVKNVCLNYDKDLKRLLISCNQNKILVWKYYPNWLKSA